MVCFLTYKLAPVAVFGSLCYAATKLISLDVPPCKPSDPYALPFTSIQGLDDVLCLLVTMFHKGFTEENICLMQYLLACVPVVMIFFSVEARRAGGAPWLLSFALPWGLAFQFISFGLGMPLYCLAFLLLGAGSREGPSLRITEPDAIAILTGFMTSVMVSFNVFFTQSPYSTAIWQFFPVYHALAQQIYLSFRPSRPESSPGNSVVQATYLVSFFISSYVHLATVLPLLSDPAALQDLFLPLISVGADASLEVGFKNLIKWDMILGMGALQLCTLWFAQSAKEFVGLLVANVVVGTMVGPGGAFASIMIWRESKFEPEASLLFRKG